MRLTGINKSSHAHQPAGHESLASENASRLASMERASKNIDELLEQLHGTMHRLRQSGIDGELVDVIAGFGALPRSAPYPHLIDSSILG